MYYKRFWTSWNLSNGNILPLRKLYFSFTNLKLFGKASWLKITIRFQYHLWFPCCFSIYCTTFSRINDKLNFHGIHLNARLNVNYEIHWPPWINVLNFKHAKFLARLTWPKCLTSINTFGIMKKFSCFVSILSPSQVNYLYAYVTYSTFHTHMKWTMYMHFQPTNTSQ